MSFFILSSPLIILSLSLAGGGARTRASLPDLRHVLCQRAGAGRTQESPSSRKRGCKNVDPAGSSHVLFRARRGTELLELFFFLSWLCNRATPQRCPKDAESGRVHQLYPPRPEKKDIHEKTAELAKKKKSSRSSVPRPAPARWQRTWRRSGSNALALAPPTPCLPSSRCHALSPPQGFLLIR